MAGSLNERERQVLEAVIETYVETAEPAGSRTISKKFGHTLSAATIRNTMSDLEEKGYLYHPHTSAGRIPTDLAYRVYVNSLMRLSQVSASDSHQIREELAERNAVDQILERAAQVLGVLTKELGVAVGPTLDEAVLERLELLQAGSDRRLVGLPLKRGGGGPHLWEGAPPQGPKNCVRGGGGLGDGPPGRGVAADPRPPPRRL